MFSLQNSYCWNISAIRHPVGGLWYSLSMYPTGCWSSRRTYLGFWPTSTTCNVWCYDLLYINWICFCNFVSCWRKNEHNSDIGRSEIVHLLLHLQPQLFSLWTHSSFSSLIFQSLQCPDSTFSEIFKLSLERPCAHVSREAWQLQFDVACEWWLETYIDAISLARMSMEHVMR